MRHTGDSDTVVHGDRDLLRQMCANLVENAIKHCPPGTRIIVALVTEPGIAITVPDNGPGTQSTSATR